MTRSDQTRRHPGGGIKPGKEEPIRGGWVTQVRDRGCREVKGKDDGGGDGMGKWRGEAQKQGEGCSRGFGAGRLHSGCLTAAGTEVSCKQVAICTWNSGDSGPGC